MILGAVVIMVLTPIMVHAFFVRRRKNPETQNANGTDVENDSNAKFWWCPIVTSLKIWLDRA